MSTVCAIATPAAVGGISVIRISGEKAREIADRVFKPASGRPPSEFEGYRAAYGKIYDGEERLDDGVILMFRAPHSYTGEDTAEISCHGGIYVTRRVLTACIRAGAEPAAAGEFTKRALLNGKMSLTQAEAVADIVSAQGGQLLAASNDRREGALYRRAESAAEKLVEISAQISAWIDYPEDDTPTVTEEWLTEKLSAVKSELDGLLEGYDRGRLLREGISCAIVGKPNVGKSTLMNLLAGERRSIVSDIAGTTRDVVEETVNLGGTVLRLADCAGIREAEDEVERIGVEIMLKRLERADVALAVFDGSRPLSEEDFALMERLEKTEGNREIIPVVNKRDLGEAADCAEIERRLGRAVRISATDEAAAEALSEEINSRMGLSALSADAGYLANERQRSCTARAAKAVSEALEGATAGVTPDAIGVLLEQALDAIYELSGRKASDEVIDEVFKRFCVGK